MPPGEQVSSVLDAATEARSSRRADEGGHGGGGASPRTRRRRPHRWSASASAIASSSARSSDWWNSTTNTVARSPRPPTPVTRRERAARRDARARRATPRGLDRGAGGARPGRRPSGGGGCRRDRGGARRPRRRATRRDGPRAAWVARRRRPVSRVRAAGGHAPQAWCRSEAVTAAEKALAKAERAEAGLRDREGTARHLRRRGHEGGERNGSQVARKPPRSWRLRPRSSEGSRPNSPPSRTGSPSASARASRTNS